MRPSLAQGGGESYSKIPRDLYLPSSYPKQLLEALRVCSGSRPPHIHLLQSLIQLHPALLVPFDAAFNCNRNVSLEAYQS